MGPKASTLLHYQNHQAYTCIHTTPFLLYMRSLLCSLTMHPLFFKSYILFLNLKDALFILFLVLPGLLRLLVAVPNNFVTTFSTCHRESVMEKLELKKGQWQGHSYERTYSSYFSLYDDLQSLCSLLAEILIF